jgi:intracellular sulfur oxidation DsrE/DsrF family protein
VSRQKVVAIASIAAAAVILAAAFAALPRSDSTKIATNSSASGQEVNNTKIRNIIYNVKFECGTISGSEGPLRPGHYDTDIGILNKQDFAVKILWSATANDGKNTNSILRTLQPQGVTDIVCKDLRQVLVSNQSFVEGFVIINVPVEPGLLGSLSDGTTVFGRAEDINLLEVQAFYTANALDELPHEVLVDKITFVIVTDASGKIPQSMMMKMLDVTVPSAINEISDPESRVRLALAAKYSLSEQELAGLEIEIQTVGVGVGTMIDDHAISHSTIMPQAG